MIDDRSEDEHKGAYESSPLMVWGAVLGAVVVMGAGAFWWKKHHRRYVVVHHGATASTGGVASAGGANGGGGAPTPVRPDDLAMEIWVKSADDVSGKLVPPLLKMMGRPLPPGVRVPFLQVLTDGMPPEVQKDMSVLDFSQPLGWIVVGGEGGARFAVGASVRDTAQASKTVVDYAKREGATIEHSDVLGVDLYRGSKSGRYLGFFGTQVVLATDRGTFELAAPRLRDGLPAAKVQTHDVMARASQAFLTGPFTQNVERWWLDWTAPQLGGATTGPAKALFDEIATSVKTTWTGAQTLDAALDIGEGGVSLDATVAALAGSPFATFLGSFPTTAPAAALEAPRDAMSAALLKLPPSWFHMVQRFLTTPSPELERQLSEEDRKKLDEARKKADLAYGQFVTALEGEVLYASVIDADGGPGASYTRLSLKDEGAAKTAAHDVAALLVPPQLKATTRALTVDGGSGEALEIDVPAQGALPATKAGLAWVVKGGYLWVVRGSRPGERVVEFATAPADKRLAADALAKEKLSHLPAHVAAMFFNAPLREGTHVTDLLKAAGQPATPLPEALIAALETNGSSAALRASIDMSLVVQLIAPILIHPVQPPPGALPPDAAASGTPGGRSPAGIPGTGLPPGIGITPRPPTPPGGTGRPGVGGGTPPPVYIPPAPTGYVLPNPRRPTE